MTIKQKLNFEKMNGLLPVVIQDYQNNEVLMVGFVNEEAWKLTKKTGKVHYWSRKKKRIWMKGEESGHFQLVKEVYLDNDNDTLLIKVNQIGGAVEDGYRSCFYRIENGNKWTVVGEKIFDPKKVYKKYTKEINFAIPCGSLYSSTLLLLSFAGYELEIRGKRSMKPTMRFEKNIKLIVARAQEIPKLIESGQADIGLTGIDMIEEYGVDVTDLADLKYNQNGKGHVNWVLAVPEENKKQYNEIEHFNKKKIATELPNLTRRFFMKHNIPVEISISIGSTEAKAPILADAIIDLCETGTSLKDNGLIPLYTITKSTVHLFANNMSMAYGWKRRQIEDIMGKLKKGTAKLPKNPKKIIKLPTN